VYGFCSVIARGFSEVFSAFVWVAGTDGSSEAGRKRKLAHGTEEGLQQ
jgi:hypothetical protein